MGFCTRAQHLLTHISLPFGGTEPLSPDLGGSEGGCQSVHPTWGARWPVTAAHPTLLQQMAQRSDVTQAWAIIVCNQAFKQVGKMLLKEE